MSVVVLLGPQRLRPTLRSVVADYGITGSIAAITAGWREREDEDDELAEHLEEQTTNLGLYRRLQETMDAEPELRQAYRELRAQRHEAQELYRLRLDHALAAVRAIAARLPGELAEAELKAAYKEVRRLDERHLKHLSGLENSFSEQWTPESCRPLREHREEIVEILSGSQILAIAGGHVGVLTELLRLFGLRRDLERRSVLAWSAGAMALGRRIVLFHDNPPQGFGNAEVWGPGLGLYETFLVFPHARRRLALEDTTRVSIVARRFAPQKCVPMDEGELLPLVDDRLTKKGQGRLLLADGAIGELAS